MSKTIRKYSGKTETIYIQYADEDEVDEGGPRFEVWLDRKILGLGHTELEALQVAWRNTGDILLLISEATISASSGGD